MNGHKDWGVLNGVITVLLPVALGDRAHQPFRDRKFLAGVSNWLADRSASRSVQVLP
jgi:hypothetical protein